MAKGASVTNDEVQAALGEALSHLSKLTPPADTWLRIQSEVLVATLTLVKAYSASSNGIPGLRGKGLAEALSLAEEINGGNFSPQDRRLNLTLLGLALRKV